jgi:nucleoid-associated protein EbfC
VRPYARGVTDQHDPASEPGSDRGEAAGLPDVAGLGDLGDLGGGGLAGLLEQAQHAMAAQQEAAEREVEGVSGGGAVRIRATGGGRVLGVEISPEVVDPDDVPMLEDLVTAALHDLSAQMTELQQEAMGGLGDLLGGGGGLGDLLGGG